MIPAEAWPTVVDNVVRYAARSKARPCSHVQLFTQDADAVCQARPHIYASDITYAAELLEQMRKGLTFA